MSSRLERASAAVSACRSFQDAHWVAQLWAAARMANAPLGELEIELLTLKGRILSVGCGFGVVERYLARRNPGLEIVGFELDEARVRAAAATQSAAGSVVVYQGDVTKLGEVGLFDGALAIDVLHHLEPQGQSSLLAALARLVRPGGTVLIKDIATTPSWKHAFNALHDRLAVGDETHCRDPAAMSQAVRDLGMQPRGWRRIGRFTPYPHYVIEATVPGPAGG